MKLCHNKSESPNYKFKKLMRYFHTKNPNFKTYRRSIISFFMKNFDKINKHDLISILWLLCHLHSSNLTSMSINKIKQKYIIRKKHSQQVSRQYTYLRGEYKQRQDKHHHKNYKNTKTHFFLPKKAYMSQHELFARSKFLAADLGKGWIIYSGASVHMTAFKKDCIKI